METTQACGGKEIETENERERKKWAERGKEREVETMERLMNWTPKQTIFYFQFFFFFLVQLYSLLSAFPLFSLLLLWLWDDDHCTSLHLLYMTAHQCSLHTHAHMKKKPRNDQRRALAIWFFNWRKKKEYPKPSKQNNQLRQRQQ